MRRYTVYSRIIPPTRYEAAYSPLYGPATITIDADGMDVSAGGDLHFYRRKVETGVTYGDGPSEYGEQEFFDLFARGAWLRVQEEKIEEAK